MFLHAGAGLHGHEYSDRSSQSGQSPSQQPTRPRHPLLRTALRPLASSDTIPTTRPISHHGLSNRASTASPDDYPRLSSLTSSRRAASGSFVKKDLAVRFSEPQVDQLPTPVVSEDDASVAGSEADNSVDGSTRRTRRKRAPRKLTRFALAHPAPQLRTKQRRLVQIRPRLLLQLQEVGDVRAIPSFDVVPSSLVAGSIIIPKLAKRFPRMFRVKHELSQDDVLMVRSDDYGSSAVGSPSVNDKDVLAVINAALQQGSNRAEIALDDGSTWQASPMANGSFEFTSVDDQGNMITARWVRRSLLSNRSSIGSVPSPTSPSSDSVPNFKWTFSIIDPSTRRHPILGSLTSDSVEVYDSYTTLSTSSGRFPPTRPFSPDGLPPSRATPPASPMQDERSTVDVTPAQKLLMLATATWISLHQRGWPASANPKFSRSLSHGRSISTDVSGRRQTFNGFESIETSTPRHSWVPFSDRCTETSTSKSKCELDATPTRAMSTGRAFMKRRRGRAEPNAAKPESNTLPSLDGPAEEKSEIKVGPAGRPKLCEWIHRVWDRAGGRDKKRERELIRRKLELE